MKSHSPLSSVSYDLAQPSQPILPPKPVVIHLVYQFIQSHSIPCVHVGIAWVSLWTMTQAIQLYQRDVSIAMLIGFVMLGIVYDNTVVSVGCWLNDDLVVQWLHRFRFVLHHLLLPCLWIAVFQITQQLGLIGLNTVGIHYIAGIIAIGLLIWGFLSDNCLTSELRLVQFSGAKYYFPTQFSPIPAIVTTALMSLMGGLIWIYDHDSTILISSLFVFLANAIPPQKGGKVLCAIAELGFMIVIINAA